MSIYPNLNHQMVANNISPEMLADRLSITVDEIVRKMKGEIDWTLTEVVKICILLKTVDAEYLFVQLDNTIHKLESQENHGGNYNYV